MIGEKLSKTLGLNITIIERIKDSKNVKINLGEIVENEFNLEKDTNKKLVNENSQGHEMNYIRLLYFSNCFQV